MLMPLGPLKPPLCSMVSFTSVDGACKGLMKHQMAGNFTMNTLMNLTLEATCIVKNGYPEERV